MHTATCMRTIMDIYIYIYISMYTHHVMHDFTLHVFMTLKMHHILAYAYNSTLHKFAPVQHNLSDIHAHIKLRKGVITIHIFEVCARRVVMISALMHVHILQSVATQCSCVWL